MMKNVCSPKLILCFLFVTTFCPVFPQVASGAENEIAEDVDRVLKELDDLQEQRKAGEDVWAWKMVEAIELGPNAVPEFVKHLDATPKEDRMMLRAIPFILRGIGDRRAIPALIRAIPRCYGRDGSDMGYRCENPDLFRLMQKYDSSDREGDNYSYGRPVNEVFRTLKLWTGKSFGWPDLAYVSERGTERQKYLKSRLYHKAARRWDEWWNQNWQIFTDDVAYSKVKLPELKTDGAIDYDLDFDRPLQPDSGVGNCCLTSFLDLPNEKRPQVFYDLDTGRFSQLPDQWKELSTEKLQQESRAIKDWALEAGFDLMGTTIEQSGKKYFVIEALELQAWQLPESIQGFNEHLSAHELIEKSTKIETYFAVINEKTKQPDFDQLGKFFYITQEGSAGILNLGVEVYDNNIKMGTVSRGDDNLRKVGVHRGRRFSLSFAKYKDEP